LEEGSSTNLFVWTASGRWSYELVPASSPATMHFAIDQKIAPSPQSQNTVDPIGGLSSKATAPQSFAEEMLVSGKPLRSVGVKFSPTEVGVFITDIYLKDAQLLFDMLSTIAPHNPM